MKGSARLPGVERIRVPGEGSHRRRQDRQAHGIPLNPALRAALDKLAAELAIEPLD
jgi:LDH2 family malate/lactate/ureidoglycolate dehydrogenase